MRKLKVEMIVAVENEDGVSAVKEWENHIDYAIDMNSYPEINYIEGVTVTEIE